MTEKEIDALEGSALNAVFHSTFASPEDMNWVFASDLDATLALLPDGWHWKAGTCETDLDGNGYHADVWQ